MQHLRAATGTVAASLAVAAVPAYVRGRRGMGHERIMFMKLVTAAAAVDNSVSPGLAAAATGLVAAC